MRLTQLPSGVSTKFQDFGQIISANVNRTPEEWAAIIINALLSLLGVVFLGLAVYGGLIWMKARGNEKEVERAKEILTSAIIGIVIVFAAYAISSFVIRVLAK